MTGTTIRGYVVPIAVILLPIALLTGNLLGNQIINQCGTRQVFTCMDQIVSKKLDAYDPVGIAKIIREIWS